MGLVALISVIMFLPETIHLGSRGLDGYMASEELKDSSTSKRWVWLNPLKSLGLARNPAVLFVVSHLYSTHVLPTWYFISYD